MTSILEKKNDEIRSQFPFFRNNVEDIYLDSASTTQKPDAVLKAMDDYYREGCANVGRGIYPLANKSLNLINESRENLANFIGASFEEIIFTNNATEGINLAARSFFFSQINKDDIILVSELEHSSNFLPWTNLAREKCAIVKIIPVNKEGLLDLEEYENLLSEKVKLVAITEVSNVTGAVNDTKIMVQKAKKYGTYVLVDATQALAHKKICVKETNCDFLVGSSHKMYGPFGLGFLYVKKYLLDKMNQINIGGGVVKSYDVNSENLVEGVERFEVGTKNIASIVGFKAALDFLNKIGMDLILSIESQNFQYLTKKILKIKNIFCPFSPNFSLNVISFLIKGFSGFDIACILGERKISLRYGKMCCNQLIEKFCLDGPYGLLRASLGIYNNKKDIDIFIENIESVLFEQN